MPIASNIDTGSVEFSANSARMSRIGIAATVRQMQATEHRWRETNIPRVRSTASVRLAAIAEKPSAHKKRRAFSL